MQVLVCTAENYTAIEFVSFFLANILVLNFVQGTARILFQCRFVFSNLWFACTVLLQALLMVDWILKVMRSVSF